MTNFGPESEPETELGAEAQTCVSCPPFTDFCYPMSAVTFPWRAQNRFKSSPCL